MFSRLCNSSLKFVALKQIAKHTNGYLAPSLFVSSQKSNYATANDEHITETGTILAKEKTTLKNSDYAVQIKKHTTDGNLEGALNTLKLANTNNKSFKLDCIKIAELVKMMIEKNYLFEEVEAILSANGPSKPKSHFPLFENLMSRLAISGQVELLQKLFDTLIKYNYFEATPETAGHLIKSSLFNGAYAQAVNMYEYMDKTHQLGCMTKVLFIQLIQQKEDDLLQRVYNIHEQRYGARIALCRLGFAYSERGYDQKAKTIFEKVNDDLSKDIILKCQAYAKFAQFHKARTLLTATKGLNCNRDVIYEVILDIYIKQNKVQEALNLWREYTDDETLQSQTFKNKLVTFLNAKSMKIPSDLEMNWDLDLGLNNDEEKSDSYVNAGNLEDALDKSKQVKKASYKLDCNKVVELLTSMIENKKPFKEIEAILSAHSPREPEPSIFLFQNLMKRLFTSGQMELLEQLFDALVKYNYIQANVESTGFLVKTMLNNGAYAQALNIFEHIAKTYKLVPVSLVLFTQLIQNNEDVLLKRLFELYEQMFSTRIAYCTLGFAFIECGNDHQAKLIFEKVDIIWKDVILACRRYVKYGSLQKARTLLTATKGLICNRDVIYESILDIFIKQNRVQEALNLWREYANDETLQSQTFKNKLITLLNTNHMKIPLDLDSNNENGKSDD